MGIPPARYVLASAALVVSAALWTPETSTAQTRPQTPPVFRSGTDIVEVDVVVHGKDGTFVGDLSADDFIVEENGQPQPIQQFYLHLPDGAHHAGPRSSPGGSAFGVPDQVTRAPRVFVVVFDDEHLTPTGFRRTQAAAQSLFSRHFRSGDVGGVVYHGRMAQDRLTTDREVLLQAVRNAKPNTNKNHSSV